MIDYEDLEETLDELGISQGQRISTLMDLLKDASLDSDEEDQDEG
jgi:hypothetical protein